MTGRVWLVGAGPDAGLITRRGLDAIRHAQVILYDDLIDKDLLYEAPDECRLILVGKRRGIHSMKQEEIEKLLVAEAKAGNDVVRLKGGDGFVFGRGGEEIQTLQEAGIPWEMIPGVTSAIAVPAGFGIPVTHRGVSDSFTVVTGHGKEGRQIDFQALACMQGTLIFLMGIHTLPHITSELIKYGKDPQTPAAVLCRGYMEGSERIDGTLANIAEKAEGAATPGIIIIGGVAELKLNQDRLEALTGLRVLSLGSRMFNSKIRSDLESQGARVCCDDVITTHTLTENLPENLAEFSWAAFTSSSAIRSFFESLKARGLDIRAIAHMKFACVGPGSAETLAKHGIRADLIPEKYSGRHLGQALKTILGPEDKLLILQPDNANRALTEELEGQNHRSCAIYRSVTTTHGRGQIRPGSWDYVIISSSAAARAFSEWQGAEIRKSIICMGTAARDQMESMGLEHDIRIPQLLTAEGVCEMIKEEYTSRDKTLREKE